MTMQKQMSIYLGYDKLLQEWPRGLNSRQFLLRFSRPGSPCPLNTLQIQPLAIQSCRQASAIVLSIYWVGSLYLHSGNTIFFIILFGLSNTSLFTMSLCHHLPLRCQKSLKVIEYGQLKRKVFFLEEGYHDILYTRILSCGWQQKIQLCTTP